MNNRPLIIAHRGASKEAPENTLSAMQLAWEQGADGIECDVRLTRDGVIVALHDETLKRTGRPPNDDGFLLEDSETRIDRMTFDDARRFDMGLYRGREFKGEPLPTLQEIFDTVPEDKLIFVEVKCGSEITDPLFQLVQSHPIDPANVIVISFHSEVIRAWKEKSAERTALLVRHIDEDGLHSVPDQTELIEEARSCGADGLDLSAGRYLDAAYVSTCESSGLPVYVWTVDDPDDMKRLATAGVRGLTTNLPARGLETFRS